VRGSIADDEMYPWTLAVLLFLGVLSGHHIVVVTHGFWCFIAYVNRIMPSPIVNHGRGEMALDVIEIYTVKFSIAARPARLNPKQPASRDKLGPVPRANANIPRTRTSENQKS
jgi:hypothetical protein